ncbi:Os01g0146801 [Oryza sativa Japonica Group]|uniref:Os01g0146801 protein n=1 Tax=Oryza sativa subsp. japonica TaxID=39947 RepID=A0A0P0UXZ3_ORYSJ|nr:Os01g0146801 [Oryza sativa Japonica Group]
MTPTTPATGHTADAGHNTTLPMPATATGPTTPATGHTADADDASPCRQQQPVAQWQQVFLLLLILCSVNFVEENCIINMFYCHSPSTPIKTDC